MTPSCRLLQDSCFPIQDCRAASSPQTGRCPSGCLGVCLAYLDYVSRLGSHPPARPPARRSLGLIVRPLAHPPAKCASQPQAPRNPKSKGQCGQAERSKWPRSIQSQRVHRCIGVLSSPSPHCKYSNSKERVASASTLLSRLVRRASRHRRLVCYCALGSAASYCSDDGGHRSRR